MWRLSSFLMLLSLPMFLSGQHRSELPIELQANLSGLLMNSTAEFFSGRDLRVIEVSDYILPGVSLGYHFSPRFYLGYHFQPNRKFYLEEDFSWNAGNDDSRVYLDYESGTSHNLQAKLFPFEFGFYVSAFAVHVSDAQYDLRGVPIYERFGLGASSYDEEVNAAWQFQNKITFGAGFGFHAVTQYGLSMNLGLDIPLEFADQVHKEIAVVNEESEFTLSDIDIISRRVQEQNYFVPFQLYANIGWNFAPLFNQNKNSKETYSTN